MSCVCVHSGEVTALAVIEEVLVPLGDHGGGGTRWLMRSGLSLIVLSELECAVGPGSVMVIAMAMGV